ncbi:MAG: thiamine-monophosphate kinase, partial [Thermoguttaceae bacterium]|nr:thiamine-monophosphate kinase [Thermoguttaceae bacterium]
MPSSLESDVFRWLQSRGLWTQTRDSNPNVVVGPGDDAAVLARPAGDVVVSTDMLSDDVDFLLAEAKPELVGRKALGVNLSDLAAMAATPIGFTASVAVDKSWSKPAFGKLSCLNYLKRLCEGMLTLADEFNCPLVGGDTNCFSGPLTISITVFGVIPHNSQGRKKYVPWTRSAAQPGDAILLTGAVGGSIHGRQFTFTPRVNEA